MLFNVYSGFILGKFLKPYSTNVEKIEPDPVWVLVAYSTSLIGGALFWTLVVLGFYSLLC